LSYRPVEKLYQTFDTFDTLNPFDAFLEFGEVRGFFNLDN